MQVYKLSRGARIAFLIPLSLFLLLFTAGALSPFFARELSWANAFAGLLSAGVVCLFAYILAKVFETVTIDDHSITVASPLRKREVLLQDIAGYRTDKSYLYLELFPGRGKRLRLSKTLKDSSTLEEWAASRYKDLDEQEALAIYDDPAFGSTPAEVDARLKKARRDIFILAGVIIILSLLTIFPGPGRTWIPCLLMAGPLALLFLINKHKGLLALEGRKNSRKPTAFIAAIILPLALYLQVRNMHLLSHAKVWPLVWASTAILGALLFYAGRYLPWKTPLQWFMALLVIMTFFADSYAGLLHLDRITDQTAPEYFEARVSGKRIQRGKSRTYYLTLQPWGPQTTVKEVSVPSALYNSVDTDGTVSIEFHKGGLDIPWYRLEGKQ